MKPATAKRETAAVDVHALRIWHPFTRGGSDAELPRIVRGECAWLFTDDGRRILDAISSWWVNLHGHAHPRIANAIAEQARRLEHVLLAGFMHEPVEELAEELRRVVPAELKHVFFSDDGSTAVEVALKMAVQYWRNVGRIEKSEIVALEHAYHGDTAGAMSVSDDSTFTAAFGGMRFPVHRVHSAYCYRCPVGLTRESCHIEWMIVHPVEFLQRVRKLTVEHDVLLIADEVLTGFGRCGAMFASELAGVSPDVMCVSKGITGGFLTLGATLVTDRIFEVFAGDDPVRTFWHGHSYTGNPIACAAAVANLEIFRTEPVFERIAGIAAIHAARLPAFLRNAAVGDVRTIGTIAAIELRAGDAGYLSELRPKLYEYFLKRDILLRPLGNVIYILPPYCIEAEDLHRVYDVIEEAIGSVS